MSADHLFVRYYWTILSLGGGLAEWSLWCWFANRAEPLLLHLAMPVLFAAANRMAARAFERERSRWGFGDLAGHGVFAAGFMAMAAAAALGMVTAGWAAIGAVVHSAEAGITPAGLAGGLLGPSFRAAGTATIVLALGTMGYGYAWGHRRLRVRRIDVAIGGLPSALDGLRILHVSDLHVGPLARRTALREALARAAALAPDLVCVTGDIVDSRAADLDAWMPELARLTAPLGVYAILGNHDRYAGADRVAAALRRGAGWHVLRDEITGVAVQGARLYLVGLEDRPEPEAATALPALAAALPPGAPAVLLAHRPAVFPAAVAAGLPLMLAGHTHGGQLAPPGLPRVNLARLYVTRFDAGRFERGGTVLHVSRGLGTSGQPVRIGVPRELTVVTLRGAVRAVA